MLKEPPKRRFFPASRHFEDPSDTYWHDGDTHNSYWQDRSSSDDHSLSYPSSSDDSYDQEPPTVEEKLRCQKLTTSIVGKRTDITVEKSFEYRTKAQKNTTQDAENATFAERIMLPDYIFGTETSHLMPTHRSDESSDSETDNDEDIPTEKKAETWEEKRKRYAEIYKTNGLPVELDGNSAFINEEEAKIHPLTKVVKFGCETLPLKLLTKTFQGWMKRPSNIGRLVISTRDEKNRKKMKELCQYLPLVKVWSLPEHETSVYSMQDISAYEKECGGQDLADIYVLICDDLRMAVMAVSDYAFSVSIGGPLPGSFEFPVMKFALSEITRCNNFYEIGGSQLREQWESVKRDFRQIS